MKSYTEEANAERNASPEDIDYGNLTVVMIDFIEMERQKERLEELGIEVINNASSLINNVNSLAHLIDQEQLGISVIDYVTNLSNKIFVGVIEAMESQLTNMKTLSDNIKERLKRLTDQLFDHDGNLITYINEDGEEVTESFQTYYKKNKEPKISSSSEPTRLTYYYTGDGCESTNRVGAGFYTKQFNVNENGWYTITIEKTDGTTGEYVVLAAPTEELLRSGEIDCSRIDGKTYYRYGDVVTFTSGGKTYQGVILDSCGAAMRTQNSLFDIFVTGANAVNPTTGDASELSEKIGHVELYLDYTNGSSLGKLEV